MKHKSVDIRKRIRSFSYAIDGMKVMFHEEPNAKIHLFVTFCVIIAGVFFQISAIEWVAVVFAIGLVLSLEAINTSIENLADFVSPEKHVWIKKIKDLSAAGVLMGAISAVIIGLIVFVPKIIALFCV
ncbi:MAG: diacylglycerol kinase family protein [Bacteroidales bacterium]|nr:diacylglycerol kinase family protein [Bacteroidales bacterium]